MFPVICFGVCVEAIFSLAIFSLLNVQCAFSDSGVPDLVHL